MYPTLFKIPFLPDWLGDIKSYGVLMMIAFLSGIWLACRRAYRSQADPDIILNMGFIALIGGVIGARAMFVLHYWDTKFANHADTFFGMIWAACDIRAGGLEFWGGPLLVIPALAIYLRFVAKVSVRWYYDIAIPSLAWGLALTRIGCFLNGCCWGAICVDTHDPAGQRAALPWAVRFPYASPAMNQQYQFGQLTLPKELISVAQSGLSAPVSGQSIAALAKDGGKAYAGLRGALAAARERYNKAKAGGADAGTLGELQTEVEVAKKALNQHFQTVGRAAAQCSKYDLSPEQLAELARHNRSKPVHPAQLYATINGLLICWVLSTLFYYRKRHGIVVGWFLILYSGSRILLELIRQDNPLDVGGLTISQALSLGTLAIGVAWLWLMHTKMPLVSPKAVPFVPPEEEKPPAARKAKSARRRG